jgi:hypothetical protein
MNSKRNLISFLTKSKIKIQHEVQKKFDLFSHETNIKIQHEIFLFLIKSKIEIQHELQKFFFSHEANMKSKSFFFQLTLSLLEFFFRQNRNQNRNPT